MKKTTRYEQEEKTLMCGLQDLYNSQDVLDFNKFALTILQSLLLVEREEYLKSTKGVVDAGNGSYTISYIY